MILKDMDTAVARVGCRASQAGERIAIFGDYDVDGSDLCRALLAEFLTALGPAPAHLHSRPHDRRLWPIRRPAMKVP